MRTPRSALLTLATTAGLLLTACGAPSSDGTSASEPAAADVKLPSKPVTLNIIDVAGNLQLTQQIFENYQKAHPKLVSKITYTKATAPGW